MRLLKILHLRVPMHVQHEAHHQLVHRQGYVIAQLVFYLQISLELLETFSDL